MREVYAGDTPDFILSIRDENGTVVDASNNEYILNVIIIAYSVFDPQNVLGRFALDRTDYPEYNELLIENGSVKLILPASGTEKCVNEEIVVQIRTVFVDNSYPNTKKVLTASDTICKIIPYKE
jgi:hypothetical protein